MLTAPSIADTHPQLLPQAIPTITVMGCRRNLITNKIAKKLIKKRTKIIVELIVQLITSQTFTSKH